ncbi:MAG TPA: pyridoxamine 5'-phosphate oxidase family protein [Gemmatimonadaceae bacterium]|nr:pyridoxamine 5'-phosphate oxidase family protein [Gemmatimonadaceae bacterium]
MPETPRIHELGRSACEAILARHSVGRLAFTAHNRVDIEPLHYVFLDGWIYGRTSPGRKILAVAHQHHVAFEVDEVAGPFDWRSVVAHGGWYSMESAPPAEAASWERGVAALRKLIPGSLMENDPVPFRTVVFRIHVAEISGRECLPT